MINSFILNKKNMTVDNSLSEWLWDLIQKWYQRVKKHTIMLRENKDMLIDKWTDFYYTKYKNKKYKFENKTQIKELLDNKIEWYCISIEDNTYNDDPDSEDYIIDFKKRKRIKEFARDFHELLYDLEDHDPRILIIENEKKKQSKTKKVKNKFVARLIGLLKRKR